MNKKFLAVGYCLNTLIILFVYLYFSVFYLIYGLGAIPNANISNKFFDILVSFSSLGIKSLEGEGILTILLILFLLIFVVSLSALIFYRKQVSKKTTVMTACSFLPVLLPAIVQIFLSEHFTVSYSPFFLGISVFIVLYAAVTLIFIFRDLKQFCKQ